MRYRVVVDPGLKESLLQRFSHLPLKELLQHVRDHLCENPYSGSAAPIPYADGVLLAKFACEVDSVEYTIFANYEIDHLDNAINLLDLGMGESES
jgi:hypothetical protein